jgi:hypothetical protein
VDLIVREDIITKKKSLKPKSKRDNKRVRLDSLEEGDQFELTVSKNFRKMWIVRKSFMEVGVKGEKKHEETGEWRAIKTSFSRGTEVRKLS